MNAHKNKQREVELEAILNAIAPAADPDMDKIQRNIHRQLVLGNTKPSSSSNHYSMFWRLSYGVLTIFLAGFVWLTFFNEPSRPDALIVYTEGNEVAITDSSQNWVPAKQDDGFYLGSTIQTGPNSRTTIMLSDSAIIRLDVSSKVVVKSRHELELESGKLFASVSKRRNGETPFAVYAGDVDVTVLGTEFEVARANQDVSVSVEKGHVRVAKSDTNFRNLLKGAAVSYQQTNLGTPQNVNVKQIALWKNNMMKRDATLIQAIVSRIYPSRSQDLFK